MKKLNESLNDHKADLQQLLETKNDKFQKQALEICDLQATVQRSNATLATRANEITQLNKELKIYKGKFD